MSPTYLQQVCEVVSLWATILATSSCLIWFYGLKNSELDKSRCHLDWKPFNTSYIFRNTEQWVLTNNEIVSCLIWWWERSKTHETKHKTHAISFQHTRRRYERTGQNTSLVTLTWNLQSSMTMSLAWNRKLSFPTTACSGNIMGRAWDYVDSI